MSPARPEKPVQPVFPQFRLPRQPPPQHVIHVGPRALRRHTNGIIPAIFHVPLHRHRIDRLDSRTESTLMQCLPPVRKNHLRRSGKRYPGGHHTFGGFVHDLRFTTCTRTVQTSSRFPAIDKNSPKAQVSAMKQLTPPDSMFLNPTSGHLYCSV